MASETKAFFAPLCALGCGPVHKPFTYHAGASRSFPGGDNAVPQTAVQTADKGCTDVCIKSGAYPSGQS